MAEETGWIRQVAWCGITGETERQAKFKRLGEPSQNKPPPWREGYHWKSVFNRPWIHYERVQKWLEDFDQASYS